MEMLNIEVDKVNIIGAGLAGLSAAIALAKRGVSTRLISVQASERAQSVMAEGGINGALNTMGENDNVTDHFNDTMRAGCYIADEDAVRNLTNAAPRIIEELSELGVPFNRNQDGSIMQRNFGGQKKKRTAYAKSSTGKIIMTALIGEARRYEAEGLIERYSSHEFLKLLISEASEEKSVYGVMIKNTYTNDTLNVLGPVILCYGGFNGFFPGYTTGTTANSGEAAAMVFSQGVVFSNLEMIQYHPTTIKIPGKRCLVSEAARGEGGRLFIMRNGKPWYFMEEKYPELGNLMPRDVVSREMYFEMHDEACDGQVYLDMRNISDEIWKNRLSDLRQEIIDYLLTDPAKEPVPVEPGIHYFMGGIDVDVGHRTNILGLYAAGECCSLYHGANRLGGNSLLGAIYGGKKAANTLYDDLRLYEDKNEKPCRKPADTRNEYIAPANAELIKIISDILYEALGIVRNEGTIKKAISEIEKLIDENKADAANIRRLCLAKMMLISALTRNESRGAHYRSDYPETVDNDRFKGYIKCGLDGIIDA